MALTKKKKIAIGVTAVVLLIILIVVVSIVVTKKNMAKHNASQAATGGNGAANIQAKGKMVQELCAPTNYKETCEKSLEHVNSADPKVLIQAAFDAAEKNVNEAIKNSSVIQAAATDPNTKGAFEVCKEVLGNSVRDLKTSVEKLDKFDDKEVEAFVFELKVWLSAAMTNQETCIDAFAETKGDTGEKMKQLLKTASELSSNGLAMADELKRVYSELMGEGSAAPSRRLLASNDEDGKEVRHLSGVSDYDYVRGPEPPAREVNNVGTATNNPRKARHLSEIPDYDYVRGPEPPAREGNKVGITTTNPSRRLLTSDDEEGKEARYLYESFDYIRGPETPDNHGDKSTLRNSNKAKIATNNPSRRLLTSDDKEGKEARYLYAFEGFGDYQRGPEPPVKTILRHNNKAQVVTKDEEIPSFVSKTARRLMATPTGKVTPDVVVAQDGSGKFKTISEVFETPRPQPSTRPYIIHVKAGVYKEYVTVPLSWENVVLVGDGPTLTKVVGNKNQADGVSTYFTATVAVDSAGFMAKDIGFENTAGASKKQAIALRVSGDRAVLHNVRIEGFQDTLCAHAFRQFYRDCYISGTVDFVFGDALAYFQNCRFVVRKPDNEQDCMITAQGRMEPKAVSGFTIQNGEFVAEPEFHQAKPKPQAFLGRPWKAYAKVVIINSNITGFIDPAGWSPWRGTFGLDTLYYGEYGNSGEGSDLSKRPDWKGYQRNFTPQLAETFTPNKVFGPDQAWIRNSGVPYYPGMSP